MLRRNLPVEPGQGALFKYPLPILADELDARGLQVGSKRQLRSPREIGFVLQKTKRSARSQSLDFAYFRNAASFAAEDWVRFAKSGPPALTASALAASEGGHLVRRRSRRWMRRDGRSELSDGLA
jgi:hypothetical protein